MDFALATAMKSNNHQTSHVDDLRGSITAITASKEFELYIIKDDLKVNPIPQKAQQLRSQAMDGDGLCSIEIPAFTNKNSFLDTVKKSVTGNNCGIKVCRSAGCHACFRNNTCTVCGLGTNCDEQQNIEEYKNCDCDIVVTTNPNSEFTLYTGKESPLSGLKYVCISLVSTLLEPVCICASFIQGRHYHQ